MIVRYSDAAERRLLDIWRYSRRRWGEARADRYVRAMYDVVRRVADSKAHSRSCDEIHPGLRLVRSGSHHIYFVLEAHADVLHVVDILHQRMEPRRRLRKALKGA